MVPEPDSERSIVGYFYLAAGIADFHEMNGDVGWTAVRSPWFPDRKESR